MFAIAHSFTRKDSTTEQELTQRWKEIRERGVSSYKRRVLDIKRWDRKKRALHYSGATEEVTKIAAASMNPAAHIGGSEGVFQAINAKQAYEYKRRGGRRGQGKKRA